MKKLLTGVVSIATSLLLAFSGAACSGEKESEHEALILTTYCRGYQNFDKALKAKYPEINIEYVSYKGKDATDYALTQLRANDIPDIFCISAPSVGSLQKENLYNLAGEDFIKNMNMGILNNVKVDGGIYLLPTGTTLLGIYYNKTLFEEHGWQAPNSMKELRELVPQIKEAGVKVAENYTQYTGASFQLLFDTSAPQYFTTLTGVNWMNNFLDGTTTATGNLESVVDRFQEWIDLGMITTGEEEDIPEADRHLNSKTSERFKEGNTAFILTNSAYDWAENSDGTGDQYGMIPFLSEDGTNNIIVTYGSSYYGISNKLKGQKLKDALKVMEFMYSEEGLTALNGSVSNSISTLKGGGISEDSPLYDLAKLVDDGKSMAFVQTGWDIYMDSIGSLVMDFTKGNIKKADLLSYIDALPKSLPALATVEEDLTKQQVAQIVGAAYAEATGADLALISIGDFHGFGATGADGLKEDGENSDGVNAKLYKSVTLDTNVVCTFNPLGWKNAISTLTLTGAQIKGYAQRGFFYKTAPTSFEYLIVKPDGMELDDEKTYTVAVSTEYKSRDEDRKTEGNLTPTNKIGQDAIIAYVQKLGTINSKTIVWKKSA